MPVHPDCDFDRGVSYETDSRGHKARGYEHDCNVGRPVAAGFMPACLGFESSYVRFPENSRSGEAGSMHFTSVALYVLTALPISPQTSCLEQLQAPEYSNQARRYNVQPIIRVRFLVDKNGEPGIQLFQLQSTNSDLEYTTFGLESDFFSAIETSVRATRMPPQCEGAYDLTYRFLLGRERSTDANVTLKPSGPREVSIRANRDVVVCSIYSIDKPSALRKFFRKVLRKKPLAPISLECR